MTKQTISRRTSIKAIAGTAAFSLINASSAGSAFAKKLTSPEHLKGRIKHSVCRWCYGDIPLEELCKAAKEMGITAIDLLDPNEWATVQKHGLSCAMAQGAGLGITQGFNDLSLHNTLIESYEKVIPQVAAAGLNNIICFSGNRNGLSDEEGLTNCTTGLKRLMPIAEKHNVTMVMELLNSKVDHHDYQCDHTLWGAALCERIGSEHFKLLYDIYHMQIMEGDVIATIDKYHPYIAHYHTAGVPGRNELDENQELYYPAIMRAIAKTGFTGFVAQEFIPLQTDKLASLRKAIALCDI